MPFRLDEYRAKIQFITFARMPSLIYKACLAKSVVSNTRYIQEAVCMRLADDLGIPYTSLLDELPPTRGTSGALFGEDRKPIKRGRDYVDERVY